MDCKSAPRIRQNAPHQGSMALVRSFLYGLVLIAGLAGCSLSASVVYEATSPYHHIRVVDQNGVRTLSFDQSQESRMSLANPLTGHFQYTEFFHTPWLFNPEMKSVLMIGLGGGSIQRAYQHYYPDVAIDTVELDPTVIQVAKNYFFVAESPTFRVHVSDGRLYLRRTEKKYDAIIMDAYKWSRYGSFIPYHLITKEFFELARDHLTADGVVAYNVIGTLQGWRADILGAVYQTMKSVFPQVYLFPATDSWNVVMVASQKPEPMTLASLQPRVAELISRGRGALPTFRARVNALRSAPPPSSRNAPVLTDDYAPVDGLLSEVPRALARRQSGRGGGSNASPTQAIENEKAKAP